MPLPQLPQLAPPQSMPVSVPFFTPSEQRGTWHTPPVHTPLVQSPANAQVTPLAHGEQLPPPQSTPVSVPFFTPSVHTGARHTPPEHTRFVQSVALPQP
jgi:hypothetical protein